MSEKLETMLEDLISLAYNRGWDTALKGDSEPYPSREKDDLLIKDIDALYQSTNAELVAEVGRLKELLKWAHGCVAIGGRSNIVEAIQEELKIDYNGNSTAALTQEGGE